MKEASGIQILGNLYNAPLESSAPDASKWSRPGSVHMRSELIAVITLVHGRTLVREPPLTLAMRLAVPWFPSPVFTGSGPQVPTIHRFDVPVLALRTWKRFSKEAEATKKNPWKAEPSGTTGNPAVKQSETPVP